MTLQPTPPVPRRRRTRLSTESRQRLRRNQGRNRKRPARKGKVKASLDCGTSPGAGVINNYSAAPKPASNVVVTSVPPPSSSGPINTNLLKSKRDDRYTLPYSAG